MRLIDADRLYDQVEARYRQSSGEEHRTERSLLDAICDSPTIDAIPVEWLEDKELDYRTIGDKMFSDAFAVVIGESFKACEDTLLSWAAEHPEPVYPTWLEWLEGLGLGIAYRDGYDANGVEGWAFSFNEAEKPIPADIAQKLGIEPREG